MTKQAQVKNNYIIICSSRKAQMKKKHIIAVDIMTRPLVSQIDGMVSCLFTNNLPPSPTFVFSSRPDWGQNQHIS